MVIWGALMGFLILILGITEVIHTANIRASLAEITTLAKTVPKPGEEAAFAGKVVELRNHMGETVVENAQTKGLLAALILFLAIQVAFLEYHWVAKPVAMMSAALRSGDAGSAYVSATAMRRDEIGVLGRALLMQARVMREREAEALDNVTQLSDRLSSQQRREDATAQFRQRIESIVTELEVHATRMSSASGGLINLSRDVEDHAGAAAGSTRNASTHVDQIARAAENTAAVMARISGEADHTSRVSNAARTIVHAAETDTDSLKDAAQLIEQIVALIQDIASQTNLLALNATIEAARAGESGRGFAVVAAEVKQLAQRTSQATSDVRARLDAVVGAAASISGRIRTLVASIEEVDQVAGEIVGLIRQQGQSSHTISEGTAQTAKIVRDVSGQVEHVAGVAGEARVAADTVADVAKSLNVQAVDLRSAVDAFMEATQRIAA